MLPWRAASYEGGTGPVHCVIWVPLFVKNRTFCYSSDFITYMSKVKFKVSDKLVKARDGASYDIKNYTEGVDYVMRGCFKGEKAVFRADILGASVVDPSKVEHKQEVHTIEYDFDERGSVEVTGSTVQEEPVLNAMLELGEQGLRIIFPQTEHNSTSSQPEQVMIHQDVQECKIKQIYPNFKWVETDKGRVYVGLKGVNMKRGQIIRVKNGELFLGKTGPSGSMVRI